MFDPLSSLAYLIGFVLGILYVTSPIWLPILVGAILWNTWTDYILRRELSKKEFVLLEIRIPKEIKKSPAAMEIVFGAMSGSEPDWYKKYWVGESRPWYSLEILSIGGAVHFLIWTEKKFKNVIETQIYSQYPGVEIYEVPDYARDIIYDLEKNKMWGSQMVLTKPDPYPIKTYVEYGVDADKDTHIDPMSVALEYMGSLQEGEQAWIQVLIRPYAKVGDKDKWEDDADNEIKNIVEKASLKKKDEVGIPSAFALSEMQKEQIKAIEKSKSKPVYECGIRLIYFADKDKFDPGRIGGLLGMFKQYGSLSLNGFKPENTTKTKFPWYDFNDYFLNKKKNKILDAYKRRSLFYPPYKDKYFILTTEELATIYHFPGKAIATPTLGRIESKKAEPPSNLPV
jgi:hypothetical protein